MSAVPRLVQDLDRSRRPDHDQGRYWGLRAVLERIDGRIVREGYYARLANYPPGLGSYRA